MRTVREIAGYLRNNPKNIRKFIVAVLGAVAIAISEGVLPESVGVYVTIIGPFLTAYGVYRVPNEGYEPKH